MNCSNDDSTLSLLACFPDSAFSAGLLLRLECIYYDEQEADTFDDIPRWTGYSSDDSDSSEWDDTRSSFGSYSLPWGSSDFDSDIDFMW